MNFWLINTSNNIKKKLLVRKQKEINIKKKY